MIGMDWKTGSCAQRFAKTCVPTVSLLFTLVFHCTLRVTISRCVHVRSRSTREYFFKMYHIRTEKTRHKIVSLFFPIIIIIIFLIFVLFVRFLWSLCFSVLRSKWSRSCSPFVRCFLRSYHGWVYRGSAAVRQSITHSITSMLMY